MGWRGDAMNIKLAVSVPENAVSPSAAALYADAFARQPPSDLIANVHTRMLLLEDGPVALPVTVNEAEYGDSYVCSPHTAYALYSKEEMRLLSNPVLRWSLSRIADAAGHLAKAARINRMVQVNNWLLSTNLYPRGWRPGLPELTDVLTAHFPDHYICFRSLNRWSNAGLMTLFGQAGYKLIASRQVYVYEDFEKTCLSHSNTQVDLKLLRRSPYRIIPHDEMKDADFERFAALYAQLYIEKYSAYNPRFTARYMRFCHRHRLMQFTALRAPDGRIDGILGSFTVDGVITAPIVGYDTGVDRRAGLYRMLMALVFEQAIGAGHAVNLSSGAASFKHLRGGVPYIEYSAVFDRHLATAQRAATNMLAAPVNGIGVPLMRRLQL
jgi:hypothetical protein